MSTTFQCVGTSPSPSPFPPDLIPNHKRPPFPNSPSKASAPPFADQRVHRLRTTTSSPLNSLTMRIPHSIQPIPLSWLTSIPSRHYSLSSTSYLSYKKILTNVYLKLFLPSRKVVFIFPTSSFPDSHTRGQPSFSGIAARFQTPFLGSFPNHSSHA